MKTKVVFSIITLTLILVTLGQNNSVIDSLENVLETAMEDTARVNTLNLLSEQYRIVGDHEMAMQSAESALELAKTLDYKKGIANSYESVGYIYEQQGDYPKALENFFTWLKISEEIGDKKGIVSAYDWIGYIYELQRNYPKALENYLEALNIYEEIGDKFRIGRTYFYIGNIYIKQGKYEEAVENYSASLKISEEIGDKTVTANIYTEIGRIYVKLGNYAEALENFLAALNIFKEIQGKWGIATSYNNIGAINQEQGNYSEALEHYIASLKIREEIGDKVGIATSYNNIGNIYDIQKDYAKALEHYFLALKINKEEGGGDKINIANMYNNIGNIYQKQGNYPEAMKNQLTALNIREEIRDWKGIVYSYNSIGNIYKAQENYAEALENYFTSLKISKEIQDKAGIVDSYRNIGFIYQKQGNFQDARKYLDDGLTISKESGYQQQIMDLYESISTLDSSEGNYAQALEHYKMYTLYKDSLFNKESSNQIAMMKIQYETEKKDREIEILNNEKALQEHQLEDQRLIRNGMIAGVFLIILVGLLLFRSFRLRKKLEKQQAIIQERHRISADLHDDVGSGLSKIMLLSELLKTQAKTPENRKEAEKISETALELSSTISEIIWALNSNNDYLENMVAYIRRYAAEYFEKSPVNLKIITDGKILPTPLSGEHRRNIFYTVKEALNNILKHAEATEAELKFVVMNDKLDVIIRDNGKGIPDEDLNRFGNGINNMRARMKSIRGDFKIESHQGTSIFLKLAI